MTFRYDGGRADEKTLVAALQFLVSIEPDPQEFAERCMERGLDEGEEYDKLMKSHAVGIAAAKNAIKAFAEQLRPPTAKAMQDVYYRLTRLPKFRGATARSVASRALDRGWRGIHGWQ